jgi:alanine dehydrogenase
VERERVIWITESQVGDVLRIEDAIAILEDAFRLADEGRAKILPRGHVDWDGGILHAVGAAIPGLGVSGVKSWTWTPHGARPVVLVFSTDDGALLGGVEAMKLGQLRTAGTAALGTALLAREDAEVLAVVGTGRQALSQVTAVAAVRSLREVRIFGRDPERRAAFVAAVERALGIGVTAHDTIAGALRGAGIVTTVTRATEPFLTPELLEPGMHVNAVGAIVPTSSELDARAVARCDLVAVEWREQAERDARDLREAADSGAWRFEDAVELGALIAAPSRGRREPEDVTLLRTLGVGLADVAVAAEVLKRTSTPGVAWPLEAKES